MRAERTEEEGGKGEAGSEEKGEEESTHGARMVKCTAGRATGAGVSVHELVGRESKLWKVGSKEDGRGGEHGAMGEARRRSVSIRLREKRWKRTHQVASEQSRGDGMRHAVQGKGVVGGGEGRREEKTFVFRHGKLLHASSKGSDNALQRKRGLTG